MCNPQWFPTGEPWPTTLPPTKYDPGGAPICCGSAVGNIMTEQDPGGPGAIVYGPAANIVTEQRPAATVATNFVAPVHVASESRPMGIVSYRARPNANAEVEQLPDVTALHYYAIYVLANPPSGPPVVLFRRDDIAGFERVWTDVASGPGSTWILSSEVQTGITGSWTLVHTVPITGDWRTIVGTWNSPWNGRGNGQFRLQPLGTGIIRIVSPIP